MRKLFVAVIMLCGVSVFAQSADSLEKIASTITPGDLKTKLSIIAAADMEGRETATPGQKKAAAYIENYFKQLGLQPGNGDSYQMQFPVFQDSAGPSSLTIKGKKQEAFKDYMLSPLSMCNGNWKADKIVFAAFGIADGPNNDFTVNDIKDKWVMVAEGSPEDAEKAEVGYSSHNPAATAVKLAQAKVNGAKGLIVVTKTFAKQQAVQKSNMYLTESYTNRIPVIYVSYSAAAVLLGKPLTSFADLKNVEKGTYKTAMRLSAIVGTDSMQSSNVLALLPGTEKKDEYVFVTAHYDHLGKRDSVIYYGADDDGSGTSAVLEIAETFAAAVKQGYKPLRSIVFMTVSGEEKGLWGSDFYTSHPVYPLDKTSIDLNIDMVGRIDPGRTYGDSLNYVYTIGENKLSSELLPIGDSINNTFSRLEIDRKFNDPNDPNRFYYRSDHYNFAKNGVPVIFYFNGSHADYHRPTDTVDKINFDLMAKRVKLVFYTAWAMANRADMLKRDIPLK